MTTASARNFRKKFHSLEQTERHSPLGEALFKQASEMVQMSALVTCPACNGDGYEIESKDEDSTHKVHCPACGGKGEVPKIEAEFLKPFVRYDLAAGLALKEEGIKRMNARPSAELLDEVMESFLAYRRWEDVQADSPRGNGWEVMEFTSDEVREHANGFRCNHLDLSDVHPNSWGALFVRYAKRDEISQTGVYRASKTPQSHGRKVPVWRIKRK